MYFNFSLPAENYSPYIENVLFITSLQSFTKSKSGSFIEINSHTCLVDYTTLFILSIYVLSIFSEHFPSKSVALLNYVFIFLSYLCNLFLFTVDMIANLM